VSTVTYHLTVVDNVRRLQNPQLLTTILSGNWYINELSIVSTPRQLSTHRHDRTVNWN